MEHRLSDTDSQSLASEIFGLLRTGRQISSISSRYRDFTMADAYGVSLAVRRMREQNGEKVIGRKIGFTNRTIWPEYQVFEPIWGISTIVPSTIWRSSMGVSNSQACLSPGLSRRSCSSLRWPRTRK